MPSFADFIHSEEAAPISSAVQRGVEMALAQRPRPSFLTEENSGGWKTKSMIRVVRKNGQDLETEVKAWADRL